MEWKEHNWRQGPAFSGLSTIPHRPWLLRLAATDAAIATLNNIYIDLCIWWISEHGDPSLGRQWGDRNKNVPDLRGLVIKTGFKKPTTGCIQIRFTKLYVNSAGEESPWVDSSQQMEVRKWKIWRYYNAQGYLIFHTSRSDQDGHAKKNQWKVSLGLLFCRYDNGHTRGAERDRHSICIVRNVTDVGTRFDRLAFIHLCLLSHLPFNISPYGRLNSKQCILPSVSSRSSSFFCSILFS